MSNLNAATVQERDLSFINRSKEGDINARNELVALYEPLARKIAYSFNYSNVSPDDLSQEALLYLTKRVNDYDISKGASFMTFAYNNMLGQIRSNLHKNKHKFGRLVSLYKIISEDSYLIDFLADEKSEVSDGREGNLTEASLLLRSSLDVLPFRERKIIDLVLLGKSRKEIAKEIKIEKGDVDEYYKRALRRLRKTIRQVKEGKLVQEILT